MNWTQNSFKPGLSVHLSIRLSFSLSVGKIFSWELKKCVKMEDVVLSMEAQI